MIQNTKNITHTYFLRGKVGDAVGPVSGVVTDPTYIDVTLPPSTSYTHTLPSDHSAFVYVFEGEGEFGPADNRQKIPLGHLGGM